MRLFSNERGDTLVEVTIAFAIMSLILVASYEGAIQAFYTGQQSRERSIILSQVQADADALKSFRDSHTWSEFMYGDFPNYAAETQVVFGQPICLLYHHYCGVTVRYTTTPQGCIVSADGTPLSTTNIQTCTFHMDLRAVIDNGQLVNEWVPGPYGKGLNYGDAGLNIWARNCQGVPQFTCDGGGAQPDEYEFMLGYTESTIGKSIHQPVGPDCYDGCSNYGELTLRLANLTGLQQ